MFYHNWSHLPVRKIQQYIKKMVFLGMGFGFTESLYPTTFGKDYKLSKSMAPLERHKQDITLLSNLWHKYSEIHMEGVLLTLQEQMSMVLRVSALLILFPVIRSPQNTWAKIHVIHLFRLLLRIQMLSPDMA